MIYYNFKNYEEFKELFGVIEHGNGVKSRKNKILLALYKDKNLLHQYAEGRTNLLDINNLTILKTALLNRMQWQNLRKEGAHFTMCLNGRVFFSDSYETDDMCGLCEDGTLNAVRYVNVDKEKVFKMKAGKMFNHLMTCNTLMDKMPEQIKRWLSEEFVADWIEYARENTSGSEYELHVDENFSDIYDSDRCAGYDEDSDSFGSCMVNDGQWTFYRDAVDAKAAYLTNSDDMIVARCIVFNDVTDENGKRWRLAERQYSCGCDLSLQRQLVSALIRGGYIDGYKKVGASCHDSRAFVDNEGNSLADKRFRISCTLEDGDTLSYQDSFKWYDPDDHIADNFGRGDVALDITDVTIDLDSRHWSEYNGEYIREDDAVYVETRCDWFYDNQVVYAENEREDCFEDDCIRIGGYWYYAGLNAEDPYDHGLAYCEECEEYYVADDACYSELTDQDYCCGYCRDRAEQAWKEDNWYFSEYDDEYFENEDDITIVMQWNKWQSRYEETTIHRETLGELFSYEEAVEINGIVYIDDIGFDGEPIHFCAANLCAA
jgi:hypothetical protein